MTNTRKYNVRKRVVIVNYKCKIKIMKTMFLLLEILDISIPLKGEPESAPAPNFLVAALQPWEKRIIEKLCT